MVFAGFLIPYLYVTFTSFTFGIVTKRRLENAIAPSFFMQIIIMLCTAMVFNSLTLGVIIYILSVSMAIVVICINKRSILYLYDCVKELGYKEGFIILSLMYLVIYISNYGVFYEAWDEFSHWGMFAKEMFNSDKLYCTSNLVFSHKDYVPAISIFEMLWCKLSLKYSDANTYRGMQMLQASMLLPLATTFTRKEEKGILARIKNNAFGIITVFGVLLFFGRSYHTIYQDLIYGIIVFYCIYIVVTEKNGFYKYFALTLSLTILVLSKMTAMAFLPMIAIFYYVWNGLFEEKLKPRIKKIACNSLLLVIPLCFWFCYKKYVDLYVVTNAGQTYDGLLTAIRDIFEGMNSNKREILFIVLRALFSEEVFWRIPIMLFIAVVTIICYLLAKTQKDDIVSKKVKLISLWVLLASLAYTIMTGGLYLLIFSDYEAKILASYARYFCTIVLADILVIVLIIFFYSNEIMQRIRFILTLIIIENSLMFLDLTQLMPGKLMGEEMLYGSEAEAINRYSGDNDSILIITYASSGYEGTVLRYYCSPRTIVSTNIGKISDEDIYGTDITPTQLVELASEYDMLYLYDYSKTFITEYKEAFANPGIIRKHRLYYSTVENGRIKLTEPG